MAHSKGDYLSLEIGSQPIKWTSFNRLEPARLSRPDFGAIHVCCGTKRGRPTVFGERGRMRRVASDPDSTARKSLHHTFAQQDALPQCILVWLERPMSSVLSGSYCHAADRWASRNRNTPPALRHCSTLSDEFPFLKARKTKAVKTLTFHINLSFLD